MTLLLKTRPSTIPPRTNADEVEYAFPERIVLDDASLAEFCADMANPPAPNAALRSLFKR